MHCDFPFVVFKARMLRVAADYTSMQLDVIRNVRTKIYRRIDHYPVALYTIHQVWPFLVDLVFKVTDCLIVK